MPIFRFFLLFLLSSFCAVSWRSKADNNGPWNTLHGLHPEIISVGGVSGALPDSSLAAYEMTKLTSDSNTLLCNVQLSMDSVGFCAASLNLANCTDIANFVQQEKTYDVNGQNITGFFPVDYKFKELSSFSYVQGVYSRAPNFDGFSPIESLEDVANFIGKSNAWWLNIENVGFFAQRNLSMRSFVISLFRKGVNVQYISSSEVTFLKSIAARLNPKTKLIFSLLGKSALEPSTGRTYDSFLTNLTFVKTFASGILLSKNVICPVGVDGYLQTCISVVSDAHFQKLEVYAADFANDVALPYDYSYDPIAETLHFIENPNISLDGFLTPFPITQSMAVGCFAHANKSSSVHDKPVIISNGGAAGIYPSSTNLAYDEAMKNGAYASCSVQMTKDSVSICLESPNLVHYTTVARSRFSSLLSTISEINDGDPGIFTFDLTWNEIKSLKPAIYSPFSNFGLMRNPKYANAGSLMTLSEFLALARKNSVGGFSIKLENVAFLEEKRRFPVIDTVIEALQDAGYSNQTVTDVILQSSNISVLKKFKQLTTYNCMYLVDELVGDADLSSIEDIKMAADSVAVNKRSIYAQSGGFTTVKTNIVQTLHFHSLKVFAQVPSNEFPDVAFDFFSDVNVQINTLVRVGVDGIITDFPETASRYKGNNCRGKNPPVYMKPILAGAMLQLMSTMPPASPPLPSLLAPNVVEPPLPPFVAPSPSITPVLPTPPTSTKSKGQPRSVVAAAFTFLMVLGNFLLL